MEGREGVWASRKEAGNMQLRRFSSHEKGFSPPIKREKKVDGSSETAVLDNQLTPSEGESPPTPDEKIKRLPRPMPFLGEEEKPQFAGTFIPSLKSLTEDMASLEKDLREAGLRGGVSVERLASAPVSRRGTDRGQDGNRLQYRAPPPAQPNTRLLPIPTAPRSAAERASPSPLTNSQSLSGKVDGPLMAPVQLLPVEEKEEQRRGLNSPLLLADRLNATSGDLRIRVQPSAELPVRSATPPPPTTVPPRRLSYSGRLAPVVVPAGAPQKSAVEDGQPEVPQATEVPSSEVIIDTVDSLQKPLPAPTSPALALEHKRDGRIRVVVRKRPFRLAEGGTDCLSVVGPQLVLSAVKQRVDLSEYTESSEFKFDSVFDEHTSNDAVYSGCATGLLDVALAGGSASVFAYGQTGSGKTYTMMGTPDGEKGIYLLAVTDLVQRLPATQTLQVSFYEIYCNALYDLLNNRSPVVLREDGKRKVNVCGLSWRGVTAPEDLWSTMQLAMEQRRTGSTSANERSSRSHAVMTVRITDSSNDAFVGTLNFVDLAGSERGADTASTDRVTRQEGAEINKSLLALKECIRALDEKKRHVPFRGSRLTEVLRDSFTGMSKTVMIANVSPSSLNYDHTANTLRYAFRVQGLSVASVVPSRARNAPRPFQAGVPARPSSRYQTEGSAEDGVADSPGDSNAVGVGEGGTGESPARAPRRGRQTDRYQSRSAQRHASRSPASGHSSAAKRQSSQRKVSEQTSTGLLPMPLIALIIPQDKTEASGADTGRQLLPSPSRKTRRGGSHGNASVPSFSEERSPTLPPSGQRSGQTNCALPPITASRDRTAERRESRGRDRGGSRSLSPQGRDRGGRGKDTGYPLSSLPPADLRALEEMIKGRVVQQLRADLGTEIKQMMDERDSVIATLQQENARLRDNVRDLEARRGGSSGAVQEGEQ